MPERLRTDFMPSEQASFVDTLSFLKGSGWLARLRDRTKADIALFYIRKLAQAQPGMGYCIDERAIVSDGRVSLYDLKPAFVGGAAGWTIMYMMQGMGFTEALDATEELYRRMGWGDMEAHIDDAHGHIREPERLVERNEGCGFLGVWQDAVRVVGAALEGEIEIADPYPREGTDILAALRHRGARIIPLAGDHKTDSAHVVVNFRNGTTLNRAAEYRAHPAFLWDAWASADGKVRAAFNAVAGVELSGDQFLKLQTAMHLATGLLLNAVRLDRGESNLVILEP